MYLNYKFYITILKDAYGCWSLTVHGCVNIHIVVMCKYTHCCEVRTPSVRKREM